MSGDFKSSLAQSISDFNRYIKPVLQEKFKTQYISVEANKIDELAKLLDTLSGIDLWQYTKEGMRGIASRIQRTKDSFDTFTIRNFRDNGARTEYEKRRNAIENDYLYPYYTIQGYIVEDKLASFALAKTEDIMDLISIGCYTKNHTGRNQIGQAGFYVVLWSDLQDQRKPIVVYKNGCFKIGLQK